MGSANYYLKAKYSSPEDASEAKDMLAAFIRETSNAYHFWQDHRDWPSKKFWAAFAKFPLTLKFIDDTDQKTNDCNNGLAGVMSFTESSDSHESVDVRGSEVWYHANVWHFADWGQLCQWLKEQGAVDAIYTTDERDSFVNATDPFANIKFPIDLKEAIGRRMMADLVGASK
jgi:hypothetical protein